MMTITRRRGRVEPEPREDATWLRWADGTIADTRTCPTGRMDKAHWTRTDDRTDAPNSVCACHQDSEGEAPHREGGDDNARPIAMGHYAAVDGTSPSEHHAPTGAVTSSERAGSTAAPAAPDGVTGPAGQHPAAVAHPPGHTPPGPPTRTGVSASPPTPR